MIKYALIASLAASLGLSGAVVALMARNGTLAAKNAALRLQLDACKADAINIKEDKETDDAVDNMPNDGLRNVDPNWMHTPGSGGLY